MKFAVFLDVAVIGDTNLELPSALSNKSVVEVHMNTTHNVLSRQSEITVELPLHARYPVSEREVILFPKIYNSNNL